MKSGVVKYIFKLKYPMIILWCYLIWYISIMSIYFDSSIKLWASSFGIALIIGFALNLSTTQKGKKQDKWVKFRLFLFPFCVSSYSATIKGHDFILLFPNNPRNLLIGTVNCLFFVLLIWFVKKFFKFYANSKVFA